MSHLIATFQQIDPAFGQPIQPIVESPQSPPLEELIIQLLNQMAAFEKDNLLVLDDYHLITSYQVHQTVNLLLDHQPDKFTSPV